MSEATIDYSKIKNIHKGILYEFHDPAKLRAKRESMMFRQTDVAKKIGALLQTYARWERDIRSMPADKFSALCELLRVRASELRPD